MPNENLAEQLNKLKTQLAKWQQELETYKKWALANDGVISKTEKAEIDRRQKDITDILARIAQIEKAKGISPAKTISAAVGKGAANKKEDVLLVQNLLIKKGYAVTADGDCGAKTIAAIEKFQKEKVGINAPDGKIDPGGKTWNALNGAATTTENSNTVPTETPSSSSTTISASVGAGATNKAADVKLVQSLLIKKGYAVTADGDCGPKTIAAIKKFQQEKVGIAAPDGKIDPDGKTWNALNGTGSTVPENTTQQPAVTPNATLSGQVGQGKANKAGDVAAIQQLLNTHGYKFTVDGVFTAALSDAIKKFQKEKVGSANPDGVVDPGGKTWKTLKGENTQTGNGNTAGPLNKPNWIGIAEGEIGQKEKAGTAHNPKIIEYHATTGKFKDDETAWCSSFVNWVMNKAGQGGTNSASAISWAKWGKKVDKPAYGAIAVIDWDGPGPGWKGHVGFVVGMKGSSILLLGGNQSNAVNISSFGTGKVIAYVYPSNFKIPENFYTFGEATGDFGEDTDIGNTR